MEHTKVRLEEEKSVSQRRRRRKVEENRLRVWSEYERLCLSSHWVSERRFLPLSAYACRPGVWCAWVGASDDCGRDSGRDYFHRAQSLLPTPQAPSSYSILISSLLRGTLAILEFHPRYPASPRERFSFVCPLQVPPRKLRNRQTTPITWLQPCRTLFGTLASPFNPYSIRPHTNHSCRTLPLRRPPEDITTLFPGQHEPRRTRPSVRPLRCRTR